MSSTTETTIEKRNNDNKDEYSEECCVTCEKMLKDDGSEEYCVTCEEMLEEEDYTNGPFQYFVCTTELPHETIGGWIVSGRGFIRRIRLVSMDSVK